MRSYSEDLHIRVVEYVKSGHTYRETSEVFGVSPREICRWKKLDREGKSLKYEPVPRSPHRVNYEKLLEYVKEHPDAYLREISAHFSVAITTIWTALKRLGVKYKKTQNISRIRFKETQKIYRIRKKLQKVSFS